MKNERIKNFWIKLIEDLKLYKGVAPNLITENKGNGDDSLWKEKLNQKQSWSDIRGYAMIICEDISKKATVNITPWFADLSQLLNYMQTSGINVSVWNEWNQGVFGTLQDHESEIINAQTHLRVDDLTELNDSKYAMDFSLEQTLFWVEELRDKVVARNFNIFDEDPITKNVFNINGDKVDIFIEAKETIDTITPHLGAIDLKSLATALNDEGKTLTDAFLEIGQLNQAVKTVLNCNVLPADYSNQLTQLKTNSDQYTRIHTKLGGKVSDAELDTLLSTPPPPCSHSDYNTIKQERDTLKGERDTLKTENTQLKTDSNTQVANKEKEIREKLIADCNLGLDKNSNLEQIITKIKELINTPDNSQITSLRQQLSEKEAIIQGYQNPTPTNLPSPVIRVLKEEMVKCGEKLNFTAETKQSLQQATNYEELINIQNSAFSKKLSSEVSNKKTAEYIGISLGVLATGSLVILAWMMVKKAGFPKVEKVEEE